MKKLMFFLICFFGLQLLIAQLNFYEGYIVNNDGDTLKGEVKANPKKELSLFAKVMFRDQQGFTKTYKPDKIKAFGYYNPEKKKWHQFLSINDGESKFYKIAIQQPIVIYEYQFEDMQMGEFFTAKQYFIKHNYEFVRLKSKKLKKQLAEYIQNEEILSEVEKMEEIDIDKLSALFEKHYSKSSS
ncbi:MAG: hypothetical protein KatS3mg027_0530 [Bacteroidia bacterium]|nr:MAG: hypothetical protein KatS3mg027_0530 [Bacteroidia bacterium]